MFSGAFLKKSFKKAGDNVEQIISVLEVFTLKRPFLPSQSSKVCSISLTALKTMSDFSKKFIFEDIKFYFKKVIFGVNF